MCITLLTCTSCKATEPFLTCEYLNLLASKIGLNDGSNGDDSLNDLINFGVVESVDIKEYLDYDFLEETIDNLVLEDGYLKNKSYLKSKSKNNGLISKQEAIKAVDEALKIINNREFKSEYTVNEKENIQHIDDYALNGNILKTNDTYSTGDYVFLENDEEYKKISGVVGDEYLLEDAGYEEVFDDAYIEDSFELNMNDAIDIAGGELDEEVYVNNDRNLLASKKTKNFKKDGYSVSYKFKSSGITARISKKVNGMNMFFDISISNIKPSYKWDYKDGKLNEAYFKVSYKTVEEVGVSIGKYDKYYLDLKNADASSFMNLANSIIKPKSDEVEASFKICEIKTPITSMPCLYFNVEVLAKLYTSGKVEIVLSNEHTTGFEVRNGTFRYINDTDRDVDFKIGGSSKVAAGVNFNLQATKFYLMDVEVDAGIKASVSSTLHLYDSDDNLETIESDLVYSSIDELSKENKDVKVCGDISLNWLLDFRINTSRTLLYKFGFWTKKEILDEDNQVFGNKTHIENFILVDKCTRKNRNKKNNTVVSFNVDKILLNKYSTVINLGSSYSIEIKALPSGYGDNDLIYTSKDENIASVSGGTVLANNKGATEIVISTIDNKYSASLNVLVSSGE